MFKLIDGWGMGDQRPGVLGYAAILAVLTGGTFFVRSCNKKEAEDTQRLYKLVQTTDPKLQAKALNREIWLAESCDGFYGFYPDPEGKGINFNDFNNRKYKFKELKPEDRMVILVPFGSALRITRNIDLYSDSLSEEMKLQKCEPGQEKPLAPEMVK